MLPILLHRNKQRLDRYLEPPLQEPLQEMKRLRLCLPLCHPPAPKAKAKPRAKPRAKAKAAISDSFSITPFAYRSDRFLIGQNFEKAPGSAAHSGINTRSAAQLTLNLKNTGAATLCHVILIYSQILDVSAAGCHVLD